MPLCIKKNQNSLPSSIIDKSKLEPPNEVLAANGRLKQESRIGQLAVTLARKSFFGPDVMILCTVLGTKKCPSLPTKELNELKVALFDAFPRYWNSPAEFESLWGRCVVAIGQVCKQLQANAKMEQ